jgi:L-threonylcarbamoyladenylate synthase
VAFPTETVYGLGADAFCAEAVEKIFKAKGRPPENPLLVHVSNLEQVHRLVTHIPKDALRLMQEFWPGPLSIILPASSLVPDIVRGGKSGVGLRMPDHPVALKLIEQAGPLAAPSANRYGRPSPISAEHVRTELDGQIAVVLDAGSAGIGVESTLLDMQDGHCKLLRPGGIPREDIEAVLGKEIETEQGRAPAAYQTILDIRLGRDQEHLDNLIDNNIKQGKNIALVKYLQRPEPHKQYTGLVQEYAMDLDGGGSRLYSIIRECESGDIDLLVFAPLPANPGGIAAALIDRIKRAASVRPAE